MTPRIPLDEPSKRKVTITDIRYVGHEPLEPEKKPLEPEATHIRIASMKPVGSKPPLKIVNLSHEQETNIRELMKKKK